MMNHDKAIEALRDRFTYVRLQVMRCETETEGFVAGRGRREMSAIRRALYEMGVSEVALPVMPEWPRRREEKVDLAQCENHT